MTPEEIQARAREVFLQEAAELLRELEAALLDLEEHAADLEVINRVFRVMHTLKGAGATSGFRALSGFVHKIEDVYNSAREGKCVVDRSLIDLTLEARDWIDRGLSSGIEGEKRVFEQAEPLLAKFSAYQAEKSDSSPAVKPELVPATERVWLITFAAHPEIWMTGVDIGVFWDDLRTLGECIIVADTNAAPAWPEFDPEKCYLRWQIELKSAAEEKVIREVFAFAGDDADIEIRPKTPLASGAAAPAARSREAEATAGRDVLRVAASKVDRLVNLVGELVILRAQLQNACRDLVEDHPALGAVEEGLRRLSDEMREVVLEIRMMPVGEVFGKFRRVVRDLSQEMGKEVDWVVEGGETEMDKTLLDQLADPLLHMVRNSIDHGLETPEVRRGGGKSPRGTLTLKAEQRGDRVLISVRDDGRGLNAERIRAKAIEKGLLSPDDPRKGSDLFDLIFLPGFSTADTVSQLSGRGVGMDVVRRRIEALRGTVELSSEPGQGTEVRMSLPLTLAIVDGLLVEAGGETYILPLGAARETVTLPKEEVEGRQRGQILEVRGEWIPYMRLREAFAIPGERPKDEKVVVVQTDECAFGVVVDRVLGQHQTVLKSLGWVGNRVRVFSGGTVLGDGRVALVIDLPGLLTRHNQRDGSEKVA